MTPSPSTVRRGFSMIELLAVLSMTALLIALALPALKHARTSSRQTACSANLRQIALAWTIYYGQDFPGQIPPAVSFPDPAVNRPAAQTTLMRCFQPYLDDARIWRCPSDDMGYFQTYETSYEYPLALLLAFPNHDALIDLAAQMPALVPVVQDAEPFHVSQSQNRGVQAMFMDGHVGGFNP